MEEGSVETVVAQDAGQRMEAVVGIVAHGYGERHEGGQRGEDGWDALDGFFAVGTALIDEAVLGQRVEERGEGLHGTVVVAAHVFLREAFEHDDYDVVVLPFEPDAEKGILDENFIFVDFDYFAIA